MRADRTSVSARMAHAGVHSDEGERGGAVSAHTAVERDSLDVASLETRRSLQDTSQRARLALYEVRAVLWRERGKRSQLDILHARSAGGRMRALPRATGASPSARRQGRAGGADETTEVEVQIAPKLTSRRHAGRLLARLQRLADIRLVRHIRVVSAKSYFKGLTRSFPLQTAFHRPIAPSTTTDPAALQQIGEARGRQGRSAGDLR